MQALPGMRDVQVLPCLYGISVTKLFIMLHVNCTFLRKDIDVYIYEAIT